MRYPPEETAAKHQRILEQAGHLFRGRGFAGVSVSEIMRATSLTHGPFYNHFASREASMSETPDALSVRTLADPDRITAEQGIAAYVDRYLSRQHVDQSGVGCLMTALALDAGKEPAVRSLFAAHVQGTIARLPRPLPARRREPAADARAQAIDALAAMIGAVVLARAVDDAALADEILAAVRMRLTG